MEKMWRTRKLSTPTQMAPQSGAILFYCPTMVYIGAGDRTRTGTGFRPGDFKSPTSTYSITPAPNPEWVEDSQMGWGCQIRPGEKVTELGKRDTSGDRRDLDTRPLVATRPYGGDPNSNTKPQS